ncbi:winged helix-turn-helix transcriptional regulator [Isoptericola aurantiacus]|uniref:winged helix-turn-helix transcriptional regulator n=1 Tax=Isoptericola aurantiacus TaxID=3377839 RepID=UPI00383BB691
MRDKVRHAVEVCPIEVGVAVAGGDWKLTAVSKLEPGPLRFGELQRAVGPVSAKTLTRQLRALEVDGIVVRTVYPEVPPRVTYELTEAGRELATVAAQLGRWGERYLASR